MRLATLWTVVVTTCLATTASTLAAENRGIPQRPNIIFIMADDLGYGDLGCYGQQDIQTPHLDRMAREGLRFTQCYAGSTVCAPSRCTLMTGLHTGHCFIRGNGKFNLRPSDVTVAEVLKEVGYQTGLIGKWGLGHEGSTGVPTRQGFDFFYGYLDQHHAHNYYPTFLMRNETREPLRNIVPNEGRYHQGVATRRLDYSHDLIAAEALRFIDRSKDGPFFLYLALTIPHANDENTADGLEVPDYGIYAKRDWPFPQKGLAAMITRMDRDIGRLMNRLKRHGIDERTIVFFTSDNGPHREPRGPGGNNPDFFDSNGPLRGIKRDLYEGGIRVPMIVRWPGVIAPGTTSDHPWAFWDVLPTAAELAGSTPPPGLDGVSVVPAIVGSKVAGRRQTQSEFMYWEFHERGSRQAVRNGKWKAVRQGPDAPLELYNLNRDIGENRDVASDHADVVTRIKSYLNHARTPSEHWSLQNRRR